MPAFDEAFNAAYNARLNKDRQKAEQAEREQRMSWERDDRARGLARQTKIDAAMDRVSSLSNDGVVEQGAGDLSANGIQQVMASGYGGATGMQAAQELGADAYREAQRGMRAPAATPQTEAASKQALGLATGGPKMRKAKESELMSAAGDAALARGDMAGWAGLRERVKNEQYGEGLASGYKAFDEMQASGGLPKYLEELSKDGSVKGGFTMMDYTTGEGKDAKTSKYIVYDPEGKGAPVKVDMDDARHIFALRHTMEVDPQRAHAELRAMKGEQRKLAMQMLDIEFKGAGLRNDVTYKQDTLGFQRDVEQRRAAQADREFAANNAHRNRMFGLQEKQVEDGRWKPIGPNEDGTGLSMWSNTGEFKTVTAPKGVDTRTFFPKQASKVRYNENTGFYEGPDGTPVARHDPNSPGGMGPRDIPAIPKGGLRAMTRAGVDAAIVTKGQDGVVRKLWRTPEGDLEDDPAAAEQAWADWERTADTVRRDNTAALRRRGEIPDPRPPVAWANPMPASERVEYGVPPSRFR